MGKLAEALYRREEELSEEVWDAVDSLEVMAEFSSYIVWQEFSNFGEDVHFSKNGVIDHTMQLHDKKAILNSGDYKLKDLVYSIADDSVGFERSLLVCIERLVKKL